ncbi:MAG TPA: hypothetical protein VNT25_01535 [Allosphingosinicella sp.]|nr:hypothetical protein [Allosphingosinicella sp.]
MSEERPVTIYMPLLSSPGELRPVQAIRQREDIYVVAGPVGEGEEWQFPPGSLVRRRPRLLPNGRQEMVATPV